MARVRIGSAEIDLTLRTGQFTKAVEDVRRRAKSMGESLKESATKTRSLTAALAGFATAGYAAKQIFELGSAVEETGSKFDTVFGSEAGGVRRSISQFATLAGLSQTAAKEVTATTGAIVQGFGITGRAAAEMSIDVSRLAADLASFNNVPVAETARAIQAGLTGEMESLKRLGIAVLDVDVKQKALAMTGKSVVGELSRQEIVTARLALITERAGTQVGDLQRTKDTAAASARQLTADIQNLKEELSVALTPALAIVVEKVREFIGGMKLLGVEGAVAIAKFRVAWENSIFGSDEGLKKALDNLHMTSIAARDMRNEIIGISEAATGSSSGGGGSGAAQAIQTVGKRAIEAASSIMVTDNTARLLEATMRTLGMATGYAADQQERLNTAQGKFNAVSGALGFLSRLKPLSFLAGPVGLATGAVSAFSGLSGAFGGGGASVAMDPTLTIRVANVSDGTVQSLRVRMNDMTNLDVPVTI